MAIMPKSERAAPISHKQEAALLTHSHPVWAILYVHEARFSKKHPVDTSSLFQEEAEMTDREGIFSEFAHTRRLSPEENVQFGMEISELRQQILDYIDKKHINITQLVKNIRKPDEKLDRLFGILNEKAWILALGNYRLTRSVLYRHYQGFPREDKQDLAATGRR